MKILRMLLLAALSVTVLSCREHQIEGHGPATTEARNVTQAFSRIEIDAPVNAHIRVAPGPGSVTLAGYANVLKNIKTEVRNGALHIFVPDGVTLHTDRKIEATITCSRLSGLSVSGASTASVAGDVAVSAFSAVVSGTATVTVNHLEAETLSVDASGAATFMVSLGKTREVDYNLSGTAKVMAYGLESGEASVDGSGASSAEIAVSAKLTVSASGTASVRYRGEPKVTADVSGVATISKADGTPAVFTAPAADEDDDDDDTTTVSW